MKKRKSGLALLTAAVLFASCQDDFFGSGSNLKLSENEIAFRLGNDAATTRADVSRTVVAPSNVYELPAQEGQERFCLVEVVTSLDDEVFSTFDGAVTRGTPIYTENFAQVPGYNGFAGTAFGNVSPGSSYELGGAELWGGQSKYRAAFAPVSGESLTYSHNYDGTDYNLAWPDDEKLLFFLEAPAPATGQENAGVSNIQYFSDGSIEFDYQSPLDPLQQKDLLFTSKWISKDTKDTDNKILFYHALTAIRFRMGKPSEHNVQFNINKVTFVNNKSAGHCVILPNYTDANVSPANPSNKTGAAATKSAACVTWSGQNNPQNFILDIESFTSADEDGHQILQDYTDGEGNVKEGAAYTFPESFYANGHGGKNNYYSTVSTADKNFNNDKYEYTFFMLPQPLGESGITMEIEYTYVYGDGHYIPQQIHTNTAHITFSGANAAWRAGELHTYYLTSEGVYVSVEDEMDGNLKQSIEIANTGTFAQFQRALLYGNWVWTDESVTPANHLIVASADLNCGNFTDFIGKNWARGSDGFYYYKYPINVGNKPNTPLFATYTGPTTTPFPGTHLEFDISAQAVRYSSQQDDGNSYVSDFNKDFVRDQWNLANVTIVELGIETAGSIGQSVLSWLEDRYEVYTGGQKSINP